MWVKGTLKHNLYVPTHLKSCNCNCVFFTNMQIDVKCLVLDGGWESGSSQRDWRLKQAGRAKVSFGNVS